MVLQKEEIWERLKTESAWVEYSAEGVAPPTALFAAVAERQFRYVVGIWISGNMQVTTGLSLYKLEEDGTTYTLKFSPIPVAPADFRQIPKGSYSIVDPIVTFEGGTRLYGKTDVAGMSLNVTVDYWDWDI
ncbi:MAG: hypothetical protein ACETVR_03440 [Candidatus Bathyarchaeia archaeon]